MVLYLGRVSPHNLNNQVLVVSTTYGVLGTQTHTNVSNMIVNSIDLPNCSVMCTKAIFMTNVATIIQSYIIDLNCCT